MNRHPPYDAQYAPERDGTCSDYIVDIQFVKTHPNARLPTKAYHIDNCYDLYAVEETVIPSGGSAVVPVGLKLAYISPGFGLAIRPRSGLGFKSNIQPHLGEIDNGYRGDMGIKLYNLSNMLKVKVPATGTALDISDVNYTSGTNTTGPIGGSTPIKTNKPKVKPDLDTVNQLITYYVEANDNQRDSFIVKPGDRIAQFKVERVWYAQVSFTNSYGISERGENGFGSSGS